MNTKKNRDWGFVSITGLIAFLVFFSLGSSSAQEAKAGINIHSFMPDFYEFWEKTKDQPLEKKIELWDSLFEDKHSEFYQQVIYEGLIGEELKETKSQKLKSFLGSLQDGDVQRMRQKENEVKTLIPQALEDLAKIIPGIIEPTNQYIIPSLNTSSGAARPYGGEVVVYYGLEILIAFKNSADIKASIVHETFHVLQFRRFASDLSKKYGQNAGLSSLIFGEGPLFFAFMEGLAVYATEKVYPGVPRPGIIEENVPRYEANFAGYTKELLDNLDDFDFAKYKRFFWDPNDDPTMPEKFGYWLGYKIINFLSRKYSIVELMKFPSEKSKAAAMEEIKKMIK